MGTWFVGEYTDVHSGEMLDLIGDEAGQPSVVRVLRFNGQDVMLRAELDTYFELTVRSEQEWQELADEAQDEGPETFAHFQMIRARHAA